MLRKLGARYEQAQLATFKNVTDLSAGAPQDRKQRTLEAIHAGAPIIYQAMFSASLRLGNQDCDITGIPDFLILEGGEYVIRDVKMTRRVNEKDHPEILRQLQLYGRFFELATGKLAARLEVFNGAGDIVVVEPAASGAVEGELSQYLHTIQGAAPPFEPVGWTKCGDCGYRAPCWKNAEDSRDVALVVKVDQNLARALHSVDVTSYDDLLKNFDETNLANVQKSVGERIQKVGKAAGDILRAARALQSNTITPIAKPAIPDSATRLLLCPPSRSFDHVVILRRSDVPAVGSNNKLHNWIVLAAVINIIASDTESAVFTKKTRPQQIAKCAGAFFCVRANYQENA